MPCFYIECIIFLEQCICCSNLINTGKCKTHSMAECIILFVNQAIVAPILNYQCIIFFGNQANAFYAPNYHDENFFLSYLINFITKFQNTKRPKYQSTEDFISVAYLNLISNILLVSSMLE